MDSKYLKNIFTVHGSYYDIQTDRETIPCRNLLTIKRTGMDLKQPDVVVIMMNPGSSKPLDLNYSPPCYSLDDNLNKNILENPLVPAKPDTTQYQVMRLMEHMSWSFATILNLSDIRQAKSPLFFKKVSDFYSLYKSYEHSIFDDKRKNELAKFPLNIVPLVVGWGRDKKLLPLANLALNKIGKHKFYGIEHEPNLYSHPSPTLQKGKDAWLNAIIEQLK